MGNTTSIQQSTSDKYQEALYFVPDALQDRIKAIEHWQLSAELDHFSPETSMSAYWIAVLQKAKLLDWSDLEVVVAKCIEEILQKVQSQSEAASSGILWIIELATAIDEWPECWELNDSTHVQDPLRLHQAAADALDAIYRLGPRDEEDSCDLYGDSWSPGNRLHISHEVYKSLDLFIMADFDPPPWVIDWDSDNDSGERTP